VPRSRTRKRFTRIEGRARAGFTLIEMMAAVTLMALLAAMIGPRVAALTSADLRHEAEELARLMELGRQRSVVMGIPHRVRLDLDQVSYTLEWAPKAEAQPEAVPETEPEFDARGRQPLDLSAPYDDERIFDPLPGMLGDTVLMADEIVISRVETPEGEIDSGEVEVVFETDGTASATVIFLDNSADRSLVLEVLPLADRVRIRNDE
jgi:prepilin-type N-terminal cleavage/methylation domain-containing protein